VTDWFRLSGPKWLNTKNRNRFILTILILPNDALLSEGVGKLRTNSNLLMKQVMYHLPEFVNFFPETTWRSVQELFSVTMVFHSPSHGERSAGEKPPIAG
jgi:hypothetical protein